MLRAKFLRFAIGALIAAVGLGLAHVWIQMRVIQLAYALASETRVLEQTEATSRRLRAEVSFLKSPDRVEKIAQEQLGLVAADPNAIRLVRK